jgi:hypothetical protein
MDAFVKSTFVIALVAVLGLSVQQVSNQFYAAQDQRQARPLEEFIQWYSHQAGNKARSDTADSPEGNTGKKRF